MTGKSSLALTATEGEALRRLMRSFTMVLQWLGECRAGPAELRSPLQHSCHAFSRENRAGSPENCCVPCSPCWLANSGAAAIVFGRSRRHRKPVVVLGLAVHRLAADQAEALQVRAQHVAADAQHARRLHLVLLAGGIGAADQP